MRKSPSPTRRTPLPKPPPDTVKSADDKKDLPEKHLQEMSNMLLEGACVHNSALSSDTATASSKAARHFRCTPSGTSAPLRMLTNRGSASRESGQRNTKSSCACTQEQAPVSTKLRLELQCVGGGKKGACVVCVWCWLAEKKCVDSQRLANMRSSSYHESSRTQPKLEGLD